MARLRLTSGRWGYFTRDTLMQYLVKHHANTPDLESSVEIRYDERTELFKLREKEATVRSDTRRNKLAGIISTVEEISRRDGMSATAFGFANDTIPTSTLSASDAFSKRSRKWRKCLLCDVKAMARGLCRSHYAKDRRARMIQANLSA